MPSVPLAPDEGAFNALLASGIAISSIEELAHGSTVATNAVLERKGFPTAFVTSKGFRGHPGFAAARAVRASTISNIRNPRRW